MTVKGAEELAEVLARTQAALDEAAKDVGLTREAVLETARQAPGMTVADLAGRLGLAPAALVAFAETAAEALGDRPLTEAAARRAAVLATAADVWEREIGPLLGSAQVRELLGVSRQRVDERLRTRHLIGMRDRGGRWRFPAFQFEDGQPNQKLVRVYWKLVDAPLDGWSAAAWLTSPEDLLDSRSPVQHLRSGGDPAVIDRLADADVARLAQ
jgi:uncharacterized protein (DUF2384 family)